MPRSLFLLALVARVAAAQDIPLSQHATVSQRVGATAITIDYNRPVARGRKLFGDLVPWGEIWHPGANDATTITFSKNVLIEGKPLAKGSYTIWSIPDSTKRTVIFTNALHVWHRPYPGESHDVLRVNVTPEHGDYMEVLVYYFPVVGPDSATLRFQWGTTIVPLRIRTSGDAGP